MDRRRGLPVGAGFSFLLCGQCLSGIVFLPLSLIGRGYIGTSAKKNHADESLLYRVQILIRLYSNAPYIAIANKKMSQSCLTMGMIAAGEWLRFTISEKRADNHQLSALSLIQIQFSKSFQVQLQAVAAF